MRNASIGIVLLSVLSAGVQPGAAQAPAPGGPGAQVDPRLVPSNRAPLPADPSAMWLAPDAGSRPPDAASRGVAVAIKQSQGGEYTKALPALTAAGVRQSPLADYALYYAGVSQLRLGRGAEARQTFRTLSARPLTGYLRASSALGEAEADEALGEPAAAAALYEQLLRDGAVAADDLLMRLGKAAYAAGDTARAREAFARVYYEFAVSDLAPSADTELARLPVEQPVSQSERVRLERGRGEQLFGGREFAAARSAFERARDAAAEDDRDGLSLRIAECDYYLKRLRAARDEFRRLSSPGPNQSEALYFYAISSRDADDRAEYARAVRQLADAVPAGRWAEQALDALATSYILDDDDESADTTFRELYEKFPTSAPAERAAWKLGWSAYRGRRYTETAQLFERAAADFPHSDYRPAWLYWSGVAHEQLGEPALAGASLALATTDYLNTYYGRLASSRLKGLAPAARLLPASNVVQADTGTVQPLPPNAAVVRVLLAVDLYDDALSELRFAGRTWGDSAPIQATIAWIHRQQGEIETGSKRFTLVRGSITTMRRAYPQFMAAGGETLPREILTVIFPLAYWDLIRKYSAERDLDPYLVAALVAQESTFVPDIKSYAKAVGLMQLMPATGRRYARKTGTQYTSSTLTNPEANIKLGTAYFADLLKQFGDVHLALAGYNAGDTPVRRWLAEKPGLPREEFIDDIPYPQTQNYVKRILGTADDYRRLYSDAAPADELARAARPSTVAQGVGAAPAPGSPASKPPAKKTAQKTTKKTTKKTSGTTAKKAAPKAPAADAATRP